MQKRGIGKRAEFPKIHVAHKEEEVSGSFLRDVILGGQDGLVNVLGIVLGVGGATLSSNTVILAGLVATAAESISMAAVAYTSTNAAKSYYEAKVAEEKKEICEIPEAEKEEVRQIMLRKGFRGQLLNKVVEHLTSNRKLWLETMMEHELKLSPEDYAHPLRDALIVGIASVIGSLIPLIPFFLFDVKTGIWTSLVISSIALFVVGAAKARMTIGTPWKAGVELMVIGMLAALAGYGIGRLVGVYV